MLFFFFFFLSECTLNFCSFDNCSDDNTNVKRNPNPNPNPNLNPYPTPNQKPNHYLHSNSSLSEISSQEQLSPEQNVRLEYAYTCTADGIKATIYSYLYIYSNIIIIDSIYLSIDLSIFKGDV